MSAAIDKPALEKKPVKFSNLLLGASLNLFEASLSVRMFSFFTDFFQVTTLGQPLEVTKTTMAANRGDSFAGALGRIWGRGGVLGCKILSLVKPTKGTLSNLRRFRD